MARLERTFIVHLYHSYSTNNPLSKLPMWHTLNAPPPTSSYM